MLRFQRNAFQGYSAGKEHDYSTQHRSGRMEEAGRSQQESLGLGSALVPSCKGPGWGGVERVRKGGSRGAWGGKAMGCHPGTSLLASFHLGQLWL